MSSALYEKGVFDAIEKGNVDIAKSTFFAHGTTVVINSITERKGVLTGLVTTKGFRDSLEIARGDFKKVVKNFSKYSFNYRLI